MGEMKAAVGGFGMAATGAMQAGVQTWIKIGIISFSENYPKKT
jgi:hypothetical protein